MVRMYNVVALYPGNSMAAWPACIYPSVTLLSCFFAGWQWWWWWAAFMRIVHKVLQFNASQNPTHGQRAQDRQAARMSAL